MAASDDLSKLASRAKKEEDRVAAARQKAKAEYAALDAALARMEADEQSKAAKVAT